LDEDPVATWDHPALALRKLRQLVRVGFVPQVRHGGAGADPDETRQRPKFSIGEGEAEKAPSSPINTLADVLAVANSLGLTNVEEVQTVGKETTLDRREWRIIANTGELRGICWRTRNKERKVTRYVGKRNNPAEFEIYRAAYEGWRRANRSLVSVGILPTVGTQGAGSGEGADG
jgi:hypothetical protein